jgi:hypothetical protein
MQDKIFKKFLKNFKKFLKKFDKIKILIIN